MLRASHTNAFIHGVMVFWGFFFWLSTRQDDNHPGNTLMGIYVSRFTKTIHGKGTDPPSNWVPFNRQHRTRVQQKKSSVFVHPQSLPIDAGSILP